MVNMVQKNVYTFVNAKMIAVEITSGIGERVYKEEW
jgi:hypothetical protein